MKYRYDIFRKWHTIIRGCAPSTTSADKWTLNPTTSMQTVPENVRVQQTLVLRLGGYSILVAYCTGV